MAENIPEKETQKIGRTSRKRHRSKERDRKTQVRLGKDHNEGKKIFLLHTSYAFSDIQ